MRWRAEDAAACMAELILPQTRAPTRQRRPRLRPSSFRPAEATPRPIEDAPRLLEDPPRPIEDGPRPIEDALFLVEARPRRVVVDPATLERWAPSLVVPLPSRSARRRRWSPCRGRRSPRPRSRTSQCWSRSPRRTASLSATRRGSMPSSPRQSGSSARSAFTFASLRSVRSTLGSQGWRRARTVTRSMRCGSRAWSTSSWWRRCVTWTIPASTAWASTGGTAPRRPIAT